MADFALLRHGQTVLQADNFAEAAEAYALALNACQHPYNAWSWLYLVWSMPGCACVYRSRITALSRNDLAMTWSRHAACTTHAGQEPWNNGTFHHRIQKNP